MIVFLYGTDSYRLKQARLEIENRYKTKYASGVNFFSFDFSLNTDMGTTEDALRTSSFFDEHKLILFKNIFAHKVTADKIIKFIRDLSLLNSSEITLLCVENLSESDLFTKNKDLFKLLTAGNSKVAVIEPLTGVKLEEWVHKEFEIRDCSAEKGAVKTLVNLVGNDSWALINEVDKISAYKKGRVISADINILVKPVIDLNIFDLIDAMALKNNNKATELLYRELKTGRDPYYILTMIIYQFRNLLMTGGLQELGYSQTEIAKRARLHPFVVRKNLSSLSKFNAQDLKLKYNHLLNIDTNAKRGLINLSDSLFSLVA